MKRLTHLVTNIVLISSLVFLLSCSTDDNAARKDDNPVRIGIAWRGDSTAITFVSALQSVRETSRPRRAASSEVALHGIRW